MLPRLLASACGLFLAGAAAQAAAAVPAVNGNVLVTGDALARSPELREQLASAGLAIVPTAADALSRLDVAGGRLAVIAANEPLPPESRAGISAFLAAGGHVIVVGGRAFDYTPQPVNAAPLGRFSDAGPESTPGCRIVYPQRKSVSITRSPIEPARIETLAGPDGQPALGFRTYLRGMGDVMVEFDAASARSPRRSVLRFWARGDSYMDLLALEITDTDGKRWLGFEPIGHDWKQHAISLADFIPAGWSDPEKPWPLLAPEAVATVALGTNTRTLWREKPMTLAIGSVDLAENTAGFYAPTSAILRLRIPFLENDIATPTWLFDPFAGAESGIISAAHGLRTRAGLPAAFSGLPAAVDGPADFRPCPVAWLEHPGTRMGTDIRDDYTFKFARELRRIPIWQATTTAAAGAEAAATQTVAELRIAAAGPLKGANIGLFGVSPETLLAKPALLDSLARTILYVARVPKIAGAIINTTALEDTPEVGPTLKVIVQNPLSEIVRGRVVVSVAGGNIRGELPLAVPRESTATRTVALSAVPADFPFARFDWNVTFEREGEGGEDARGDMLADTVDVERGMLHAFAHMLRIQKEFPDGRYSQHYFGDSYGVRAMFIYLDLLRRDPSRMERNRDFWSQPGFSPESIRASAQRFFDMLVRRQNEDGTLPMGYGEHHGVHNVADGGQITLSISQIVPLLADDPPRQAAYLQLCRHFADWAEAFYIDEALSKKLAAKYPEEAAKGNTRPGHYGLGDGYLKRNPTGPVWVMPDILGMQSAISYLDTNPEYPTIVERNTRSYLDYNYPSFGIYTPEALFWAWCTVTDESLRRRIAEDLRKSFLVSVFSGKERAPYDLGARGTLRTLSLLYCRRFLGDDENVRAALLKYVWAFASEDAPNGMRRLGETHPKAYHGESITAAKYAAFGSIWAVELLDPGASLLRTKGFPRAAVLPPSQASSTK